MLSNRESARRSRHRKQAHVLEIEEKATAMEAENESMKLALARASEQELRSMEERTRLYAEIAALRAKVLSESRTFFFVWFWAIFTSLVESSVAWKRA